MFFLKKLQHFQQSPFILLQRTDQKRKVNHEIKEKNANSDDSDGALSDSDVNLKPDETERSLFIDLDASSEDSNFAEDIDNEEVEVEVEDGDEDDNEDLTAKSTERLHSPPIYEADEDVDTAAYYDYDDVSNDDAFYYVSWEDPIYHDVVYDESGAKFKNLVPGEKGNVTVDYSKFPQRPIPVHPNINNVKAGTQAQPCNKKRCRLPDCICGRTNVKDLTGGRKLPQIVVLTFDDSVNDLNRNLYKEIFSEHRVNPNGCPILATFYISHEWTDYAQVQNLYADGHEIASHSIS